MSGVKINRLQIENTKRVKAVTMEPSENGLTVIGGKNGAGKTSVLDSIAWALGGNNFKPSQATREGSTIPPYMKVTLSNGLVVERKGKNSSLVVTDPSGQKAGQQLLDSFIDKLALNLPKFMEASDQEKAETLLNIIGVGPKLSELEKKEKELYQERLTVGRIADQKVKFAKEQTYYPEAPQDLVSASDLIREQQEILRKNAENESKRRHAADLGEEVKRQNDVVMELSRQLEEAKSKYMALVKDLEIARKSAQDLKDESTEELEQSIANVDEINRKVRANMDKNKAEDDAIAYTSQYNQLTADIEAVREEKQNLLNGVDLPLPSLAVEDGVLKYKGQQWDNMSGSDRLKVATAIVRKLNPNCGFVLVDKLEQMDLDSLQEFGRWAEAEGLQIIATRVSTGSECQIIIEDGYSVMPGEEKTSGMPKAPAKSWRGGF